MIRIDAVKLPDILSESKNKLPGTIDSKITRSSLVNLTKLNYLTCLFIKNMVINFFPNRFTSLKI